MFRPSRKQKGGSYTDLYTFDENSTLYEPALKEALLGSFTFVNTRRDTTTPSANTGKIFLGFNPVNGTTWSQLSEFYISQTSIQSESIVSKLEGLAKFAEKNPTAPLYIFLQSATDPDGSNALIKYAVPHQSSAGGTYAFTGLFGQVVTSAGSPVLDQTYSLYWRVSTDKSPFYLST